MSTSEKPISGTDGAVSLIEELNKIFAIYASDLKTFRTGGTQMQLLSNTEMFDMVVKLLNVSDKIKKLATPDQSDAPKQSAKIRNIQDMPLNGK